MKLTSTAGILPEPSVTRSASVWCVERVCDLDPGCLDDPHWRPGRQRPRARLLAFLFAEVPTPAAQVWRSADGRIA
jgi:hypothetical protein